LTLCVYNAEGDCLTWAPTFWILCLCLQTYSK